MMPASLCPVPRLMHRVDGERDAMGEERHAAVVVEIAEKLPEQFRLVGKLLLPIGVPLVNDLRRLALLQPRPLNGRRRAFGANLQATRRRIPPEGLENEGVQCGEEGDVRVVRQRVPQGERPVRRQFHDQALGQRLETVFLGFGIVSLRPIAG